MKEQFNKFIEHGEGVEYKDLPAKDKPMRILQVIFVLAICLGSFLLTKYAVLNLF